MEIGQIIHFLIAKLCVQIAMQKRREKKVKTRKFIVKNANFKEYIFFVKVYLTYLKNFDKLK